MSAIDAQGIKVDDRSDQKLHIFTQCMFKESFLKKVWFREPSSKGFGEKTTKSTKP